MATMELVILSSSPMNPHRYDSTFPRSLSSSPNGLPSPNALILQKQALRRGVLTPSVTASLSTSAGSLSKPKAITQAPQDDSIWDFPEDTTMAMESEQPNMPKPKVAPKQRAKRATVPKNDKETTQVHLKKPRKSRAKKTDEVESNPPLPKEALKEKAVRKSGAKKADAEGQTKFPKGRVTKSSTHIIPRNDGKTDGSVSAYFTKCTNAEDFIDIDEIAKDKNLNLQEAIKRRTDWTPPKPSKENSMDATGLEVVADIEVVDLDTPAKGFTDLFASFGYSKAEELTSYLREPELVPARKRKLIELVRTSAITKSPQLAPKAKAVKKQPTTITERATAAYALDNEDDMEPTPPLQYLSHQNPRLRAGTKPRARNTAKKSTMIKKAAPPPPTLLNPQAALEQANRQEFVFGTSSQLARDNDPVFLRDLQQAIQLSGQSRDPFTEDLPLDRNATTSGRKFQKTKPSLWEAALMIEEEGATEVEILDLINSSQVETQLQQDEPVSPASQSVNTRDATLQPNIAAPISSASNSSAQKRQLLQHANPIVNKPNPPPELSKTEQCPNFDTYSTTELAKELASYKFKPIKKRDQMIVLLEKCWQGKQRAALGPLGVNTLMNKADNEPTSPQRKQNPAATSAASPLRPRGRPRKDGRATAPSVKINLKEAATRQLQSHGTGSVACDIETPTTHLAPKKKPQKTKALPEEISDSDTPLTPSPPRRHASRIRTPPSLHLTTEDIGDITLSPLSPSSAEQELFANITKAVTTAPRGTSQAPSWHERILMYDPIVLEDLTRWLNTTGLDAVGYDGETTAGQVKAWCRVRSVCCLWKSSSRKRGGVKKIGQEF